MGSYISMVGTENRYPFTCTYPHADGLIGMNSTGISSIKAPCTVKYIAFILSIVCLEFSLHKGGDFFC